MARPTEGFERIVAIDVARALALFGVLMINLLVDFRTSVLASFTQADPGPGTWNHLVDAGFDIFVAGKAYTALAFLLGVGMAMQGERATVAFLARRFLMLFGIGLVHMVLVWNGDILMVYAVSALLVLPLFRRSAAVLVGVAIVGTVLVQLLYAVFDFMPHGARRDALVDEALRVYGHGSYLAITAFRVRELGAWLGASMLMTIPRSAAVFLLGVAAWRQGWLRDRRLRRVVAPFGLALGIGATLLLRAGVPEPWFYVVRLFRLIPFALGYLAALLWLLERPWARRWLGGLAPLGRMALTCYLLQSLILGWVFYGYGLGLFGQLGPAAAAPIGVGLYVAQLGFSRWWLARHRFGPAEWLWRKLSYGR